MARASDDAILTGADRRQAARAAAGVLQALDDDGLALRASAFVGFDGFVDSICRVVQQRRSPKGDGATLMSSMRDLARRIEAAAGASANIELLVERVKIGGNGPILALALATLGARVRCAGALSRSEGEHRRGLDPVFAELARRCVEVISLGPAGRTDALEFHDGKIMLGKLEGLAAIDWDRVLRAAGGVERLRAMLADARVIAAANWTMLLGMDSVWEGLARDALPVLPADPARRVFVDLADPAKRSDEDIRGAMDRLRAVNAVVPVVLGVNAAEAQRLASLWGASLQAPANRSGAAAHAQFALRAARCLREALGLSQVVAHTPFAAAASDGAHSIAMHGAFTHRPALSTGAGDHFNAGYCLGLALQAPLAQRLALGIGVSGWCVRHAASPTRDDLADFLHSLPEPETGEFLKRPRADQ